MPEPVTIGALVAGALAAGATEAGKAALGAAAKDAYEALRAGAVRVLGPAVGMLEKKPDSEDLAAGVAEAVDAAPEAEQSELRALAEALKSALPEEARTHIDNRVMVIATHGGTAIGGHNVHVTLPGKL